jgi:hypothetical protein
MSRDLDFCLKKDNPKEGIVFAGFYTIGTFKIVEEQKELDLGGNENDRERND